MMKFERSRNSRMFFVYIIGAPREFVESGLMMGFFDSSVDEESETVRWYAGLCSLSSTGETCKKGG